MRRARLLGQPQQIADRLLKIGVNVGGSKYACSGA